MRGSSEGSARPIGPGTPPLEQTEEHDTPLVIRWASEPRDGIEAHTLDAEGRTCAALGIREETGWDRGLSQANASALAVAEDGLRRLALH